MSQNGRGRLAFGGLLAQRKAILWSSLSSRPWLSAWQEGPLVSSWGLAWQRPSPSMRAGKRASPFPACLLPSEPPLQQASSLVSSPLDARRNWIPCTPYGSNKRGQLPEQSKRRAEVLAFSTIGTYDTKP